MKKKRKHPKKMTAEQNEKGQVICPDCKERKHLKMHNYRSAGNKTDVEVVYICTDCNVKITITKPYLEIGGKNEKLETRTNME